MQVYLVAVLGKPVGRLGDFRLGHKIAVAVLRHRLVDNARDVVGLRVRLDDSAIGGERGLATVLFLDKELPLVGGLVHEADELDFRVRNLVGFFQAFHALSPPFTDYRKI